MYSADGEYIEFSTSNVICKGPVEYWFSDIGKFIKIIEKQTKFKCFIKSQRRKCEKH